MLTLGINTATTDLSIAVLDGDTVLGTRIEHGQTAKAEQLVPWIQELLEQLKLKISDIRAIGVAQGPGAFTGLRIGVTTAKTLAQMLEIPIAGISTIHAYAYQCRQVPGLTNVRILLKACRGEYNTGTFTVSNSAVTQHEADHPQKEEELWDIIRTEDTKLLGDVPEEFKTRLIDIKPDAISIAQLAQSRIERNDADKVQELMPVYSHGANIRLSPRIHGNLTPHPSTSSEQAV